LDDFLEIHSGVNKAVLKNGNSEFLVVSSFFPQEIKDNVISNKKV